MLLNLGKKDTAPPPFATEEEREKDPGIKVCVCGHLSWECGRGACGLWPVACGLWTLGWGQSPHPSNPSNPPEPTPPTQPFQQFR